MSFTETTIYTKPSGTNWAGVQGMPWPASLDDSVQTTALLKKYNADWNAYYSPDHTTFTNIVVFPTKEDFDGFFAEPWVIDKRKLIDLWTQTFNITLNRTIT